jgi:hypothetical protein
VRDPHAAFARLVAAPVDSNEMEHWLGDAVRRQTDHTDTHPCLADRLRAIGVAGSPPLPVPMHESAAATLLGRSADGLALELDHRWWADVEPRLTEARAAREAGMARLAELDAGAEDREAGWERIELLERLGRTVEAKVAAEAYLVGPSPRSVWSRSAPQ